VIHVDLFSGIGGFAYAADQVFGDVEHIFCDNDKFCQQILKKHWPEAPIYDDIRTITADSYISRHLHGEPEKLAAERHDEAFGESEPGIRTPGVQLLTGGFPCQPFSAAGLRRGTADDRHLWPEMLRVIRLTKPKWVIAENVRGLLTWNEGLVFEQVCTDLEAEGYEVQPLIIPAIAVNAPHRRDRIWFIAYASSSPSERTVTGVNAKADGIQTKDRSKGSRPGKSGGTARLGKQGTTDRVQDSRGLQTGNRGSSEDPISQRSRGWSKSPRQVLERQSPEIQNQRPSWESDWLEVAAELCGVDDGLPTELDGFKLSKPQHRKERLKSLGNAIVPQVAIEIMQGIKSTNQEEES